MSNISVNYIMTKWCQIFLWTVSW